MLPCLWDRTHTYAKPVERLHADNILNTLFQVIARVAPEIHHNFRPTAEAERNRSTQYNGHIVRSSIDIPEDYLDEFCLEFFNALDQFEVDYDFPYRGAFMAHTAKCLKTRVLVPFDEDFEGRQVLYRESLSFLRHGAMVNSNNWAVDIAVTAFAEGYVLLPRKDALPQLVSACLNLHSIEDAQQIIHNHDTRHDMILGLTDAEGIAAPLPDDSNNIGCYFIQIYSTSKQIFYLPNGKVYHALHLTFSKLLDRLKAGESSVKEWLAMLRSLEAIHGNRSHDGARMEVRGNPVEQTRAFMGLNEDLIRRSCYIIPVEEFW